MYVLTGTGVANGMQAAFQPSKQGNKQGHQAVFTTAHPTVTLCTQETSPNLYSLSWLSVLFFYSWCSSICSQPQLQGVSTPCTMHGVNGCLEAPADECHLK